MSKEVKLYSITILCYMQNQIPDTLKTKSEKENFLNFKDILEYFYDIRVKKIFKNTNSNGKSCQI